MFVSLHVYFILLLLDGGGWGRARLQNEACTCHTERILDLQTNKAEELETHELGT